jgi:hypothetical protein
LVVVVLVVIWGGWFGGFVCLFVVGFLV